jgi:hypothetical protein
MRIADSATPLIIDTQKARVSHCSHLFVTFLSKGGLLIGCWFLFELRIRRRIEGRDITVSKDLLYLIGFVIVYIVLNQWVLPRFGVRT